MKLVVLISVFILLCGISFMAFDRVDTALFGRLALAAMFVFTGVIHIVYRDGIYLTYPDFLPQRFKIKLLLAVGDLQFAFAAGFIFSEVARILTVFVLVYLLLGFFTLVNASSKKISIKRGNHTGNGHAYLFYKIPEQLIVIVWTYYFGLVA